MVNIGLIGLGKMGLSHLAIVNSHPSAKLVGVCDTASYVCSVLHKYSGIEVFSNYREMLDQKSLDAVIIATPSRSHGEIVREALLRGLHVFCEKPFCLDVAEGTALAELAERKGVVNQVGYHYRFVGAFNEAKRLLEAQALGRIHHVRVEAYGPVVLRPKGGTWRAKSSEGGGCLHDYACHAIDLVNYLVGKPDAVSGTVLHRIFSRDVDDEVYATLHFADGMTGSIAANWSDDSLRRMSTQVTLWGTNGRMIVDRQEVKTFIRDTAACAGVAKEGWDIRHTTDFHRDVWYYLRGEEYSAQIDYFIRSIVEGRRENISSFASAVQTDSVVSTMLQDTDGARRRVESGSRAPAQSRTGSGGLLSLVTGALK
jgi:scyllo-inositol 2-dehydrogenase (NADP+)